MSKYGWLTAAALIACASAANAQSTAFDDRWYITPMIGGLFSDSENLDTGAYGSLAIGKYVTPHIGVELEGGFGSLSVSDLPSENAYDRFALGFNVMGFLTGDKSTIRPYLLLNGHGQMVSFLGEDLSGLGLGAGGGLMAKLGRKWDARFDLRYNLDSLGGEGIVPSDTFYLWNAGIGVSYKFGNDPYDQDGDGVPDDQDKCPDTPPGVAVYSDGCPTDLDQDGVPDYLDKCPNTPKGTLVGPDGCELDSDHDGVPDSRDQCPNTPPGIPVNAVGCPLDSDGDGVPDYLDKCAGTPAGTQVNAEGCSMADRDGDGIPDELDKCPGTPPGIPVGQDGCPLDSDGDGIPDYLDECPKSPPGAKVLPNGCALTGDCRTPRPGEQVDANGCALEQSFVLRGVKFEFDSDRLTPAAREILNQVAETLKAYPSISVDLEGHTDNVGSDSYNLGLSERRAIAVKVYLAGRGIKEKRMNPVGYGESRPIATNETEIGREENRRVELRVVED